ncbi:MAG TPA: ATP-binding cassette domain-containing protein [Gemmataceae bacterium]|jgi:ABC-type multidrug transport system ATPase subunit/ABC-type transporter Mla maintaining outer membrane lipid asymmetry permease subunit MlaE|nr:ATP-binding cassette domain-containing protein [Gemmataceae bacterium]
MTTSEGQAACGTPVIVRGLTLRAGGRTLLANADARFEPGQITLIVGPSGCGKSTLLRVLAGLHDPFSRDIEVSRSVSFGDPVTERGRRAAPVSVGVVFQSFALLDELSPTENVYLAWAHRRGAGLPAHGLRPEQLLAELHVPPGVPTGVLSGGQQQRLAIARALAYDPAVILYDEPTSGLDPATAQRVARLIRTTQESHPRTSIVVTHDFETLTPIADRVYLLDPGTKMLREIPAEHWHELGDLMSVPALEDEAGERRPGGVGGWLGRAAAPISDFLAGTTRFLEQVLWLPVRLLPLWRSGYWGLRFCLHYLRLVSGPLALLYVAIAGVVAGFVATYFTFRFMPYRQFTEPLVLENVLDALGFSLYRILVPVLTTILVAARCGAAVTSDVGGKVHGQQIDALRTLGVKPERYLLTGIMYSFLLGTPVLVLVAFWLARFTSLCVFTATHPEQGPFFWEVHFHRDLIEPGSRLYRGTGWLLAKLLCCAAGMGLLAYLVGMKPKRSTRDVSAGITLNILLSTTYVLLVHMIFALFEFD